MPLRSRVATFDSGHATSGVVEMPLDQLRPWDGNPRRIRPERLEQLKQALVDDPEMLRARFLIALPDGTVVCGNQRRLAAQELGWRTIPTLIVDLDPERARLWALRDNNPYGEWDEQALAELLAELQGDGVDLALTGFAGREIDTILAGLQPVAEPDNAPDLPAREPDSQPGEIYQLGRHRLACGDARDPELVGRLIDAAAIDLLWTDPPYGVGYVGKTGKALTIRNDNQEASSVLDAVLRTINPHLAASSPFYICCPAGPNGTAFRLMLEQSGFIHHQTLVWVKQSLVLGHADYHYQHEEILYGWKPGPGRPGRGRHDGSRWYGDNGQTSVFFVDRPARSDSHPTMKPVKLIEATLRNSSRRGDRVLDPFAGSGSTLIACELAGRTCCSVELDPAYCDVIRSRYQAFSDGN